MVVQGAGDNVVDMDAQQGNYAAVDPLHEQARIQTVLNPSKLQQHSSYMLEPLTGSVSLPVYWSRELAQE